jgi:hypothetical protein
MSANDVKLRAAIEDYRTHINEKPCLLCGKPSTYGGIFVPIGSMNQKLGALPGKGKVILYGLCEGCYDLPDRTERVDYKISSQTFGKIRHDKLSQ